MKNEETRIAVRLILRTLIFILRYARFTKPRINIKKAEKLDFSIQVALEMMSKD